VIAAVVGSWREVEMDDVMGSRRRYQQMSTEIREGAVAGLIDLRRRGLLSTVQVAAVADGLGVEERTVWRWLQTATVEERAGRKGRERFDLTEADVADLAYHFGNVAAWHRERVAAGGDLVSLSTLRRAVDRRLSPGLRAGLAEGERALRNYDTYLTRPAGFRNDCWEADHAELAIYVRLPDGRVVRPWMTVFVDRSTRAIPGWAMAVTASQASVLEGLRSAILVDEDRGPFGGLPARVRYDQGKEFLADAVGAAAASLGIDAKAVRGYSPHLKGTVERTHETIETVFLAGLPGFAHGPRDRAGRLVERDEPLLSFEVLVGLLAEFVNGYNTVRPHEGIDGQTPLQRWCADPTPIEPVGPERLRHLLLARVERVVTKRGVSVAAKTYNCAELCGYVGERVEVRYLPRHQRDVEVYRHGVHLGTARPVDDLDPGEVERLLRRRAEEARWLAERQRAASRRRRQRFAVMTGPGPLLPADAPSEATGAGDLAALDGQQTSRMASRSLVDHGPVPAHMTRPNPKGDRR
jgi:putative transposase